MDRQTTINVRMETQTKKEMEDILKQLGLTTTSAFNMFARALIQERRIPFNITVPKENALDRFFDEIKPSKETIEEIKKYATYEDYVEAMLDKADEELENDPELHDVDELFAEMRELIDGYKKVYHILCCSKRDHNIV